MLVLYRRHSSPNLVLGLFSLALVVLKHALISHRWAPGEGLEPSSPEGHQLARHSVCLCVCDTQYTYMISRLTPFRAYSDLPSLGTPALLICEQVLQFMPLSLW